MNDRVEKLMAILDISEAEAIEVLEDDKRIDKGEKLFELDPELEAGAKKARMAGTRKVDAYGKSTERKRKEDNDKSQILSLMLNAILPTCDTYEVANAEREFSFTKGGRKYTVVLSCPRS